MPWTVDLEVADFAAKTAAEDWPKAAAAAVEAKTGAAPTPSDSDLVTALCQQAVALAAAHMLEGKGSLRLATSPNGSAQVQVTSGGAAIAQALDPAALERASAARRRAAGPRKVVALPAPSAPAAAPPATPAAVSAKLTTGMSSVTPTTPPKTAGKGSSKPGGGGPPSRRL